MRDAVFQNGRKRVSNFPILSWRIYRILLTWILDDPDELQNFDAAFCLEIFLDEIFDNRKTKRYSTAACDHYCG